MENKKKLHEHFVILEVTDKSNFQEIKESYLHLKNLYSSNSRIFNSFSHSIDLGRKKDFLLQIENSYNILKVFFKKEEKTKSINTEQRVLDKQIPEFEVYSGDSLRITREVLGIELEDVAFSSGITPRHLKSIELELYDQLPPKAYVKAFVRKYAEFLSLDSVKVTRDYISGMEKKQSKS